MSKAASGQYRRIISHSWGLESWYTEEGIYTMRSLDIIKGNHVEFSAFSLTNGTVFLISGRIRVMNFIAIQFSPDFSIDKNSELESLREMIEFSAHSVSSIYAVTDCTLLLIDAPRLSSNSAIN